MGGINVFDWSTNQNASKNLYCRILKNKMCLKKTSLIKKYKKVKTKTKTKTIMRESKKYTNLLIQFLWLRIIHSNYFGNLIVNDNVHVISNI